jgi:hypothetical protein
MEKKNASAPYVPQIAVIFDRISLVSKGIQLGIADKIRVLVDRDQKIVQKIESGNRDLDSGALPRSSPVPLHPPPASRGYL